MSHPGGVRHGIRFLPFNLIEHFSQPRSGKVESENAAALWTYPKVQPLMPQVEKDRGVSATK
jgi:hypothetical protein